LIHRYVCTGLQIIIDCPAVGLGRDVWYINILIWNCKLIRLPGADKAYKPDHSCCLMSRWGPDFCALSLNFATFLRQQAISLLNSLHAYRCFLQHRNLRFIVYTAQACASLITAGGSKSYIEERDGRLGGQAGLCWRRFSVAVAGGWVGVLHSQYSCQ